MKLFELSIASLTIFAASCVDLPPEPDYQYSECSLQSGFWGAVRIDDNEICTGTLRIDVTEMNTLYVILSLSPQGATEGRGTLILNFNVPAGQIPAAGVYDDFFLGRYDSPEATVEVTSASLVIREDSEGVLGTYEATAAGPDGPIEFNDGVYYAGAIQTR